MADQFTLSGAGVARTPSPIGPTAPGGYLSGVVPGISSAVYNQQQQSRVSQYAVALFTEAGTPIPFNDRLLAFAGITANPDSPDVGVARSFVFQINPSRLQRTRNKIQQSIFLGKDRKDAGKPSRSQYEYHFQGREFETFQYNGVTPTFRALEGAGFRLDGSAKLPKDADPCRFTDMRGSQGWLWFLEFQDFYEQYADKMVTMRYLNAFYQGVLDDFSFTRNGDSPFNIQYRFSFKAVFEYEFLQGVMPSDVRFAAEAGNARYKGDLVTQYVVRPRTGFVGQVPPAEDAGLVERPPAPTVEPVFRSYLEGVDLTSPVPKV